MKAGSKQIVSLEIRCWRARWILGITRKTNKWGRQQRKPGTPLGAKMTKWKLSYSGHILRRQQERERPSKRWTGCMKEATGWVQSSHAGKDRTLWTRPGSELTRWHITKHIITVTHTNSFNPPNNPAWGRHCFYPHFIDEMAELVFKPRGSRVHTLITTWDSLSSGRTG